MQMVAAGRITGGGAGAVPLCGGAVISTCLAAVVVTRSIKKNGIRSRAAPVSSQISYVRLTWAARFTALSMADGHVL